LLGFSPRCARPSCLIWGQHQRPQPLMSPLPPQLLPHAMATSLPCNRKTPGRHPWKSAKKSQKDGEQPTGAAGSAYRNYLLTEDTFSTQSDRYEAIRVLRNIGGEHLVIGNCPTADCFDCGAFYKPSTKQLWMKIGSSNSFSRNGVVCFSCENQHKILPQHGTRELWNKGRQLFFL
jgi:hypothetical protein